MTVVSELLLISDAIRELIIAKSDASIIRKQAIKEGMITLSMDATNKIFLGKTSVEEVLRAIVSDSDNSAAKENDKEE